MRDTGIQALYLALSIAPIVVAYYVAKNIRKSNREADEAERQK